MNGFSRLLFFGNYFYGFCAVALSIEAALQQYCNLNSPVYYLLVFVATVLYYTHAYIAEPSNPDPANKRAVWYYRNRVLINRSQYFLTIIFVVAGLYWLMIHRSHLLHINGLHCLLLLIFPVTGALYYGSVEPSRSTHSLRNEGWIKPFVIGFVWAGAVTVYPVLFNTIENDSSYQPVFINILLFVKNFMFISMLCIMFDIKDYAADHNRMLKTFVVRIGLRKTIFYILLPLGIVGLGTFIIFALTHGFPAIRIWINTVPFILLIIVAYSMHQRKSILYYLAIIDGLMLVKAVCGVLGMILIK